MPHVYYYYYKNTAGFPQMPSAIRTWGIFFYFHEFQSMFHGHRSAIFRKENSKILNTQATKPAWLHQNVPGQPSTVSKEAQVPAPESKYLQDRTQFTKQRHIMSY